MSLNILDIIQLRCQWVVDIDNNDFPVCLFLIEQSHDTENLDLLDVASLADELANLANVERIIIASGLGFRVYNIGVFPGLGALLATRFKCKHTRLRNKPEGTRHSSRDSLCVGNSCGQTVASLS